MFSGVESPLHWVVLLVIILLVMGPKRLPEVARSLGSGLRGFKESLTGEDREEPPAQPAAITHHVDHD